ncbi:MAG: type III-B CRISPR module RAMP protein Cmr1 [Bacteroidia bacterium]|nr:type III-B CRISPR module RAMP protein Cmr1 [Bacteroidia bacterium]
MHSITFHCRTISPLFLSGPDTDLPELRPPSIKGALRFWTRAICLGWPWDNGTANHKMLLSRDEALFGGVTTGVQRSMVSVSIRHNSFQTVTGPSLNLQAGGKYLWYSLIVDGYQQQRRGIAANEPFAVTLQSRDETALRQAVAAFWVLTFLGSLGTRARRGAGSFEVVHTEGMPLPEGLNFSMNADAKQFLASGLKSARRIFEVNPTTVRSNDYSTLGRLWVSNGVESWEKAVDHIGQTMLTHRKATPNRDRAKRTFTMTTLNQKAAFGLPVSVYEDNSVNFNGQDNDKYSRRASPVCISLIKHLGETYWIVSELKGKFTPDGIHIEFHSKNPRATCSLDYDWEDADNRLLTSFFQKLTTDGHAIDFK